MPTRILTAPHLAEPASRKRALTTFLSALMLITINPVLVKLSLTPLSDGVIASVAGLLAVYVLQSGLKSRTFSVASPSVQGAAHSNKSKASGH
jgi:hypothetical protein